MEEELSAGNMIISWEMFKPRSPPKVVVSRGN
jgi:hypothetical protein